MIIRPVLAAAAALALLAGCQTPEAEAPASPAAEAAPAAPEAAAPAASAWITIAPGGDTLCATGTPFTRPSASATNRWSGHESNDSREQADGAP